MSSSAFDEAFDFNAFELDVTGAVCDLADDVVTACAATVATVTDCAISDAAVTECVVSEALVVNP